MSNASKSGEEAPLRREVPVNNAAEQHRQESIEDIDAAQLERTFRTNQRLIP